MRILFYNKNFHQTMLLSTAQIFNIGVGFFSNMILAKNMGAQQFGVYAFSLATLSFLAIFFEFGFFATGAKILSEIDNSKKEKELIGAMIIIAMVIAAFFVLTVLFIGIFIDRIFSDKISEILWLTSVVSWSFIFPFFMELILKGSNYLKVLSLFNFLWKISFLIAIIICFYVQQLNPPIVLLNWSLSCILSLIMCFCIIKPSFHDLKSNLIYVYKVNLKYGIHLYLGRIADVATFNIDKMLITYFVGAKATGLYTLAFSFANPISLLSTSMAIVKFRDFSKEGHINSNIIKFNFVCIICGVLAMVGAGYIVIFLYLGEEYKESFYILIILSLAVGLQGMYKIYNSWLSSRGFANELKKITLKMSFLTIIAELSLVPLWGIYGGAVACFISMFYALYSYWNSYMLFRGEKRE